MRKDIIRKTLVLGIVILFFGSSVVSSTDIKMEKSPIINDSYKQFDLISKSDNKGRFESENNYDKSLFQGHIAYIFTNEYFSEFYEIYFFDLENPDNIIHVGGSMTWDYLSDSTWSKEGRWLACSYYGILIEIDPVTGWLEYVGFGDNSLYGLAWDDVTNKLYGAGQSALYEVNPENGSQIYIGDYNSDLDYIISLTCNNEGTCYGVGWNGTNTNLYTISTSTGEATFLTPFINCSSVSKAEYDKDNNILYLITSWRDLYICDSNTGECTLVGSIPVWTEICAFAIPYNLANQPPAPPTVDGPTIGKLNTDITYTFVTTDPEGKDVYYYIDWGDYTVEKWIGPYPSGEPVKVSHSWEKLGNYKIKARARDINGSGSFWSDPLIVHIVKPVMEPGEISGRFLRIKAVIKNTGEWKAENISWNINIKGGLILLGRNSSGLISSIPANSETTIKSNIIIGLGKVEIYVTAKSTDLPLRMKKRDALLLGPLIKVYPQGDIYVPDDYPSINSACENASNEDKIIVRDGIYEENINVYRQLTIRSENGPDSTSVKALNPKDYVFEVTSNFVNISGFNVGNASSFSNSGFYLRYVENCDISDNIIFKTTEGISLYSTNHSTINNNQLKENYLDAIYLYKGSNNNTISNNIISDNQGTGIGFSYGEGESMKNNIIINNSICNNDGDGFYIGPGRNNLILGNIINNNSWDGIYLLTSYNNTITNNIISGNGRYGIGAWKSNDNIFYKNNIIGNKYGFYVYGDSIRNKIYLNNFIGNTHNAYSSHSSNDWNSTQEINYIYNGKPYTNHMGNFWDDYYGSDLDGDGIGDIAYGIDTDNDNFPLMKQFENYFYKLNQSIIIPNIDDLIDKTADMKYDYNYAVKDKYGNVLYYRDE